MFAPRTKEACRHFWNQNPWTNQVVVACISLSVYSRQYTVKPRKINNSYYKLTRERWSYTYASHHDVRKIRQAPKRQSMSTFLWAAPDAKKGIRSMLLLICLEIWQERNVATFQGKIPASSNIIEAVRRNLEQWRLAGAAQIQSPFRDITWKCSPWSFKRSRGLFSFF